MAAFEIDWSFNHLMEILHGLWLDALAFQMVGLVLMALTIPFFSITSVFRSLSASALLLSLTACSQEMHYENLSRLEPNTVNETPQSAFDFVNSIGLNTHLNYFDRIYGNFPLVEHELKSVGILHLRDGVHLQNADYNKLLYGRWNQLGNFGVRFDAVLDPRSNLGPLNSTLLSEVEVLVSNRIESFEGPNELDVSNENGWPAIDRGYQDEVFSSVKSMKDASSIKIIGPSLAFASNSSKVGNLSNQMDDGNLHPYPAGKMPSIVFPDQIDLEKIVCNTEPIVFTESGYHNAINENADQPGVSETTAAKYIPRLFLEDFSRGVPRTYLYEFMDEAPDPGMSNSQMHWGLIRADGSEKPAFVALKNLISELNDLGEPTSLKPLTWALDSKHAQIHHLLLQKSNGTFDLVLWQEVSSYDVNSHADIDNPTQPAVLTLGRSASHIAIYEPTMQSEPVRTFSDVKSAPLEIPDHPLVVEISF